MDFEPMMKDLLTGPLVPRTKIEKTWHEKGGIYAVWGCKELKPLLAANDLKIHASKQNNHEVILNCRNAIKRSSTRFDLEGNELFCFYVGKTAHLKKRMAIQRYRKIQDHVGQKLNSELKAMLRVSFSEMPNWEDRFYAEGYAIALLLPVVNVQPER